ncbi:sulfate adenylyltransferase subunit CysN [Moritella yayanosii]|uniref:Sulfate adenylyltransferase subunit 1 n=1 Tax=Moritella yayanosii TaxID=69539 RepID=A0A330LPL9_9GAMM|nr:sulfate adenylyltransferase subunit CysN [Moritella yayanosii]SQD78830.1 ATP-sulfurylase, subunit 1 [Moritella yayanosii]
MNTQIANELAQTDIETYLQQQQYKSLLRFLTCGSVDDGKSSLIGRLLHDSHQIYEDQLAALRVDSQKSGTTGEAIDLALLVDGLAAEREQGITIDVAYRYFSTSTRKFIIADTPGHEEYTRNMATGASTCDLAVILIDARKGVLTQTKRHSYIASLLGIKHFVVAVNKMDLVDFSEQRFEEIKEEYLRFSEKLNDITIEFTPLSALLGDNVVDRSTHTPWFKGRTLLECLEAADTSDETLDKPFRFPVQYVNRPNLDFRGFAGTISAGQISVGDEVVALPSGKSSTVKSIVTFDGDLASAHQDQAITLTLTDEIDVSRGDILVAVTDQPKLSDLLLANVVWMSDQALQTGRQYDIKLASKKTTGQFNLIRHKIDVNTMAESAASTLALNEIGLCELTLTELVPADNYKDVSDTGSFIVIDRLTNVTVGAGMIEQVLDATVSTNPHEFSDFEVELNALVRKHFPQWQAIDISKL